MVDITNNNLNNISVLGLKNSNESLFKSFKDLSQELNPKDIAGQTSPLSDDPILSEQTNTFLNGEGGVSGFVENNDPSSTTFFSVVSPFLLEEISPEVVTDQPNTDLFDAITNQSLAQVEFANSINTIVKAQNSPGQIVDILDSDDS